MPSEQHRVTDEAGVEFTLGAKIAGGGQGTVYRVAGHAEYAIKLLTRPEDLKRIEAVRRLPLEGLPVAAPITLIRQGGCGYRMRLASDMTPIREPYLPWEFGTRETTAAWYLSTGGLQRRLAIAANMADTIAALHERGLAYVDLNPNNVMVSEELSRTETWLIDTDNLTSRADPQSDILGLRGYGAPERATRNSPPSTLADTYTLAIHVFRILVMRHPLEGIAADALDGGTARIMFDRGEFPYVSDPRDDSNRVEPQTFSAALMPIVISGRMNKLAERTFVAGRLDPTKRPGSARWREVLFSALDNVIECASGCGWTYFRLRKACPNCGAPTAATTVITAYSVSDDKPLTARDSFVASDYRDTAVMPRHLWGRYDQLDPVVTFRPESDGLEVRSHDDASVVDGSGKVIKKIPKLSGNEVYRLRLDVNDRPSRFLAVRSVQPT